MSLGPAFMLKKSFHVLLSSATSCLLLLLFLLLGRLGLRLSLLELLDQLGDLVGREDGDLGLAVLSGQGRQLNLLRGQLRHVEGLTQHLAYSTNK